MARTFNGSIWGNIGDSVARDAAIRREENRQALGGLLDAAKFIEKVSANRNMRDAWQKYFDDRKAAADEASAEIPEAIWGGVPSLDGKDAVNNVVRFGFDPMNGNIFELEQQDENTDGVEGSIWEPYSKNMRAGFDRAALGERNFMNAFDPNTATPEDILRAQQILVNNNFDLGKTGKARNGVDGQWGTKSINAFNRYMGV